MVSSPERSTRVLIVDDESFVRNLLVQILEPDYLCASVGSAEEALSLIEKESFDLVISDINMGGMSGIEMVPRIFAITPDIVVMMISGNQTIDNAIEAIRIGAFDYIMKPFDLDHVKVAVDRALNHLSLLREKRQYEDHLEELVKKRTEELNYLSYYDALTSLPNRALFEDRLTQAILLLPEDQQLALLFVSLDSFKKVRDTLGHDAGRHILREIAGRLLSGVGDSSTVARFEGDEFAILAAHIAGSDAAAEMSSEILKAIKRPILIDQNEVYLTASIGISILPEDGKNAPLLFKNAGVALSKAQEKGGDRYYFYTPGMKASALKRLNFENDLRKALDRGEFEMYYQPKLKIDTKEIVGMEALIRWHHRELGFVSPVDFIPLAEDTGLIIPIGEWVLHTACSQSRDLHKDGFELSLSVNLSAIQFQQRDLAKRVIAIVDLSGMDYTSLELEVTESAIMRNAGAAIQTLRELQEMGIKMSLDDFGTGHSSLSYLKRLPINILKIDKSFIDDVTSNPDDAAMVMAIITLAHNLRLNVIAEGVETEEQLKLLQLLKCDEWQGYLFSKPVPASEFRSLLAS